jgi:hypothetical protein
MPLKADRNRCAYPLEIEELPDVQTAVRQIEQKDVLTVAASKAIGVR